MLILLHCRTLLVLWFLPGVSRRWSGSWTLQSDLKKTKRKSQIMWPEFSDFPEVWKLQKLNLWQINRTQITALSYWAIISFVLMGEVAVFHHQMEPKWGPLISSTQYQVTGIHSTLQQSATAIKSLKGWWEMTASCSHVWLLPHPG